MSIYLLLLFNCQWSLPIRFNWFW